MLPKQGPLLQEESGDGAGIRVLGPGGLCSKPGSATFWLYDLGRAITLQSLSFYTVKWDNSIYLTQGHRGKMHVVPQSSVPSPLPVLKKWSSPAALVFRSTGDCCSLCLTGLGQFVHLGDLLFVQDSVQI